MRFIAPVQRTMYYMYISTCTYVYYMYMYRHDTRPQLLVLYMYKCTCTFTGMKWAHLAGPNVAQQTSLTVCTHTCTHTSLKTALVLLCVCLYVYVYMYVCVYLCVHVLYCMCVCKCTCVYVCLCKVYMYGTWIYQTVYWDGASAVHVHVCTTCNKTDLSQQFYSADWYYMYMYMYMYMWYNGISQHLLADHDMYYTWSWHVLHWWCFQH